MPDAKRFFLGSGAWSCVLEREHLWGFVEGESVRPLPGAKEWCAGWVPWEGRFVPVVRAGAQGWAADGPVLAVVHWAEHLVALPCERADLCDRAGEGQDPGEEPLLDVERLYTDLGIL